MCARIDRCVEHPRNAQALCRGAVHVFRLSRFRACASLGPDVSLGCHCCLAKNYEARLLVYPSFAFIVEMMNCSVWKGLKSAMELTAFR